MKKIIFSLVIMVCLMALSSCELDNYDGPDASVSGGIYDNETNELIEQDIINGAQIEYMEHGYENPELQYMIFQVDGTYRNDLMFSGAYTVAAVRGNFVPMESFNVQITGNAKLDFKAQPYIRVRNTKIEKVANKIIATFNLNPTVSNKIKKAGLYVHIQPTVGEPMCLVKKEININSVISDNQLFTIELDLSSTNVLLVGQKYYFRIGALIDAPEAKFNYATAVRIELDKS